MFESTPNPNDIDGDAPAALPHVAVRCLRSCTSADHAHAEGLRCGHTKRPIERLHAASLRTESRARELARGAR